MPSSHSLDSTALNALAQRDLTRSDLGSHALQQLIMDAHTALAERWNCRRELHRRNAPLKIISPATEQQADQFERHLAPGLMLRSRMRSELPDLLVSQSLNPPDDLLLVCPGVVYRRSPLTPLHASEPHQLDLWRLHRGRLSTIELADMLQTVLTALLPEHRYRLLPTSKPHLSCGMSIELATASGWVSIGHAGVLANSILAAAGLDTGSMSALGMTLGLDRVLMLRKGLPHIRLLRCHVPAIAEQMLNLQPYRPLIDAPLLLRDLELSDDAPDTLEMAEHIRQLPAERFDAIEAMEMIGDNRLRLSLRHPSHRLSEREADALRDSVAGLIGSPMRSVQPLYA